jgi:hypothetical protein
MEYYKTAFYDFESIPVFKGKRVYDDNIYTFDIETTSMFKHDGGVEMFNEKNRPKYYSDTEKIGFMYIWQFSINERVYYGRTWEEFREFIEIIRGHVLGMPIIYVHNLAFEFQFLRNVITDFNVFARKPLHPIVARSDEFGIEFRCSLMLTVAKLSKLPSMFNLPVEKLVGDLDYNKCRCSLTELTPQEMKYCENDCRVVYELIKVFKARYKNVCRIPLTQTGELRRECQKIYKTDYRYRKKLQQELTTDIKDFNFIMHAFSGGWTHANSFYTGNIMRHVHSKDITSSYPTVMIAEKYPCSKFIRSRAQTLEELDASMCWVVDIEFTNIYSTLDNNYLSISKSIDRYHAVGDNGRLVRADRARYILTDVDIEIVRECYKWDSYIIHESKAAFKNYLDKKFIKMILELYNKKTQFKGLSDKDAEYMQAKQFINSMYGMMVTNLITDLVTYEDDWAIHELTEEEAQKRLTELNSNRRTFLNQNWGVWVTAYARRNLWSMIKKIDHDVIYCDTDSIKYIHDHDDLFNEYNEEIRAKLATACAYHKINAGMLHPADTKGIEHPLGIFDTEEDYKQFVTLGAKKYAFIHVNSNEIGITVSGVQKGGASALHNLKDFKDGFTFDYQHAGKKLLSYNDEQIPVKVTDFQGHTETIDQRHGVNLMPTEYTIGISEEYGEYINSTLHYSGGGF